MTVDRTLPNTGRKWPQYTIPGWVVGSLPIFGYLWKTMGFCCLFRRGIMRQWVERASDRCTDSKMPVPEGTRAIGISLWLQRKTHWTACIACLLWVVPSVAAAVTQRGEATFAGGCFWCMEEAFEKIDGVISVKSGYHGGDYENPSYEDVSAGTTGHFESIQVIFDPQRVAYGELLNVFWRNVDPSNHRGQFCDIGPQYRSAIFYHNEEQKRIIDESVQALIESKSFHEPIATKVIPAKRFYPAETHHQDYYKKNPLRYNFYKFTCGRQQRLNELWEPERS